jgi:hypothetical protein
MLTPLRPFVMTSAIVIFAVTTTARSDTSGCRLSDQAFTAQLHMLKDWNAIYTFVKRNLPSCPDDGMYGEGYSDVIVHGLAKQWSYMPQLQTLIARHPTFHSFVLGHINATTDPDELKETLDNATGRCPFDMDDLCTEIAASAREAIKEL